MSTQAEMMTTKLGLIVGAVAATLTLADIDLILGIVLKSISIISFTIVIAINIEKFVNTIKKWLN